MILLNTTIETMKAHKSIRKYTQEDIKDDVLNELISVAQASPNSINGQQISIVAIRDKETLKKIATFTGGQTWIAECSVFLVFVMDFYKSKLACEKNERELVITDSIESIMVGSVDAGIAMSSVLTAAESLGIGTVCIGGIRNNPQEMIQLLDLPQYTFPVVGLCLGYPDVKSISKPRMDKSAYFHKEKYNAKIAKNVISEYDELMTNYLSKIGRESEGNWSKNTSKFYETVYFPEVFPVLKQQGFKNEK